MDNQYRDFEIWSRALIESKDVDPVYPLVRGIIEEYGFEPEWFAFVYTSFYSLESAVKMCKRMPTKEKFNPSRFKEMRLSRFLHHYSHERRGVARSIEGQTKSLERVVNFLKAAEKGGGFSPKIRDWDNQEFRSFVMTFPLFGEWASFKIAELFEKSLDYSNLRILDLNLDKKDPNKNDGPVGGLRWLYGRNQRYDRSIFPVWNRFGENLADAWGVDMGEVETCLCKWHKMKTGKYWVGHDIAEFISLKPVLEQKRYYRLMNNNFDRRFWHNISKFPKELKPVYFKTGKILNDDFAKSLPEINVLKVLLDTE